MGGLIFAVYIYFTIWNIFYGARKQREENYPGYYDRHGQMGASDSMDYDGMGNFGRSSTDPDIKMRKVKTAPKKRKKKVAK